MSQWRGLLDNLCTENVREPDVRLTGQHCPVHRPRVRPAGHGIEAIFRLRPSRQINQIVQYVVAVVAQRTGILLHSAIVLSNHWDVCLTDPEGRICEFTRDCHAFIARAVNAAHGDFESMWSNEHTSHVRCVEAQDLVDKIAYTMANPVEDFLVAHGKNWPGVRRAWPAGPQTVNRPKKFFRHEKDGGAWPNGCSPGIIASTIAFLSWGRAS